MNGIGSLASGCRAMTWELQTDGSLVRLQMWRMKANRGWLGEDKEQFGVGRSGTERPEERWEAEAGRQGVCWLGQGAGICLLSVFLPRMGSLLANLSLAADQHKMTA